MTDKPTDEALENLFVEETGFDIDDFPAAIFDFARAVLAKWGQPAQAAEPFCWHWENTFNGGTGTVKKNPETLGINMSHPDYKWTALYTTPQPTQMQAGAVPLTCEWTHNEDDGFWETACGEAWRFDDGGPGENNMHFCHSCGNSLRIKGGQHGTE